MPRKTFAVARLIVFAVLFTFSFISLALSADLLRDPFMPDPNSDDIQSINPTLSTPPISVISPTVSSFDLAISILTLTMTSLVFYIARFVEMKKWKRFLALVWVELSWIGILSILWLATAGMITTLSFASAADLTNTVFQGSLSCSGRACGETRALKAMAWLSWLLTFIYFIALCAIFVVSIKKGLDKGSSMDVNAMLNPSEEIPGTSTVQPVTKEA